MSQFSIGRWMKLCLEWGLPHPLHVLPTPTQIYWHLQVVENFSVSPNHNLDTNLFCNILVQPTSSEMKQSKRGNPRLVSSAYIHVTCEDGLHLQKNFCLHAASTEKDYLWFNWLQNLHQWLHSLTSPWAHVASATSKEMMHYRWKVHPDTPHNSLNHAESRWDPHLCLFLSLSLFDPFYSCSFVCFSPSTSLSPHFCDPVHFCHLFFQTHLQS